MIPASTTIEKKLQNIVAPKLGCAPGLVDLDRALVAELGLDSFTLMAVIMEIEQEFPPLSLADDVAADLKTLRDVAAYIEGQSSASAA